MSSSDAPAGGGRAEPDAFGFPLQHLTEEARVARLRCDVIAAVREVKPVWRRFDETGALPTSRDDIKRMFRKGVPPELRARAWSRVSGAENAQRLAGDGFYAALLARAPTAADTDAERQIELDLARTFGEHPWLRSAPARDALRRVLCAAARASPSTGYAQSMNYVAGFALLVYRADEEAAFWLVRAALERLAAPRTYSRDLEGLHVELRTLAALLADKAPRISAALAHLGAETSLFATEWLLCLFTCTLPAETAARVWDAFLCEGAKVLVRVSIALLKLDEPRLLRCADDIGAFVAALKAVAGGAHDREALMHLAFNGIGSLSGARLTRLRAAASLAVDAERAALAARRAARAQGPG